MIQVVLGSKGSGKTKRLIDMANDAAKDEKCNVVFLDDDKRYMYDLRHEIRFVDGSEYAKLRECSADWLFGFICGMLSANFDTSVIYIDAFIRLVNAELSTLETFMEQLNRLSKQSGVDFVLSISGAAENAPEFITRFAI